MSKFVKMSAIALAAALVVGCGSDDEEEIVETGASSGVADRIATAEKNAADAKATATRAEATARQALEAANANQRAIDELYSRANRMTSSMRK